MEKIIVLQQLHSWFKIAPGIWIALIAGWMWVLVSWLIEFEPAASGAVLVGASIIAEHVFLRWPHRKIDMDAYETAREPKQLLVLDGGHFGAYIETFDESSSAARDWFRQHLLV